MRRIGQRGVVEKGHEHLPLVLRLVVGHHVASIGDRHKGERTVGLLVALDGLSVGRRPNLARRAVELSLSVPIHLRNPQIISLVVADPVVGAGVNLDANLVEQNRDRVLFLVEPVRSGNGIVH